MSFSLSFESSQHRVKTILKEGLTNRPEALEKCDIYAKDNGFENVDVLLERIIYSKDAFNALVIIDEMPDELEKVLSSRFKFPVEFLTLQRFISKEGERIFQFEPFLQDLTVDVSSGEQEVSSTINTIDPSDIDTIVVPAKKSGLDEVFIGENCWYQIRIHSSMLQKIKYIAGYQTTPTSAITHIATLKSIEPYKDTNKYILHFTEPAQEISKIPLKQKGRAKAPQGPRYTTRDRIENAQTLVLRGLWSPLTKSWWKQREVLKSPTTTQRASKERRQQRQQFFSQGRETKKRRSKHSLPPILATTSTVHWKR